MNLIAWHSKSGQSPRRCESGGPFRLAREGACRACLNGTREDAPQAVVLGTRRGTPAVAAVIVPPACDPPVSLNGRPLAAGLHLLAHGDRLDFAGGSLFTARDDTAAEVAYDPTTHGDNLFCARTKARLKPGVDRIVVCPGAGCGLIYKAEAYELGLPCHHCRFDPSQPAWQPPHGEKGALDALLELAAIA